MKYLLFLALITSCGKRATDNETGRFNDVQAIIEREEVGHPSEVPEILREAIYRDELHEYHGTRWYLYDGTYLFRSKVLNRQTYRLTP